MTNRLAATLFVLVMGLLATAGLFLGYGLSIAVLVATVPALASLIACHRLDPDQDLRAVSLFVTALAIRWIAAAAIHVFVYQSHPGLFAPDELAYDGRGRYLAEYLAGHVPPMDEEQLPLTWMVAGCYYFFGEVPILPKLLNGLCGAWGAVLAALIARRLFDVRVARRAGLLVAVFPSLVLWSSLDVKDNFTLFGAELALYHFIALRDELRLWRLPLVALGVAFIGANRPYEVVMLAAAIGLSVAMSSPKHLVRNLVVCAVVGALGFLAVHGTGVGDLVAMGGDGDTQAQVDLMRSGYTDSANSAVNMSIVDTSTTAGLILWIPIGLMYFYLAPIPFTGTSVISLATSPEMLVWYFLLPSMVRGAIHVLRDRSQLARTLPLFAWAAVASIAWGVIVTNVGTLYRYRAQTFFVFLILIAADQVRRRDLRLARRSRVVPAGLVPITSAPGQPRPWHTTPETVSESI